MPHAKFAKFAKCAKEAKEKGKGMKERGGEGDLATSDLATCGERGRRVQKGETGSKWGGGRIWDCVRGRDVRKWREVV